MIEKLLIMPISQRLWHHYPTRVGALCRHIKYSENHCFLISMAHVISVLCVEHVTFKYDVVLVEGAVIIDQIQNSE